MSLIWKPDDPDRPQPKVLVNRAAPRRLQEAEAPPAHNGVLPRYGIVDTTFSTVDMGQVARDALHEAGIAASRIASVTVPGFKDLAVAAKLLIEREGCGIVLACGMPGPEAIDKQCGHEASLAIGQAQLLTSTHILECFVHMDEARTDAELIRICRNRVAEHALNLVWLLERPEELRKRAGTGQRQGFSDVGAADAARTESGHLRPGAAGPQ
ncbi:MAG: riboflavin synthase [Thermoplasmata archaeon]|jgi:riboflavin synthase|nr:riboflavin synthase [Thermoplasmata archaeon]